MTAQDHRKTKAELIAELEALRLCAAWPAQGGGIEESEERYRRLVAFLPDAVRVSCQGIIVYLNDAAVRLFGATSADQIIGRRTVDFVLPEDRKGFDARLSILRAMKTVPMEEQRRLRLDGSIVHVEVTWIGTTWQGRPANITVMRDITNHVRGRAALAESEQRLAMVAQNIPGAAFQCVLHSNGRFSYSYVSPGVRHLFGLEPAEIMQNGLRLQRTIHPDDRKKVRAAFRRSAEKMVRFEGEMRVISRDGTVRWIRAIARPRRRGDGPVVWEGLFLDETKGHEAEQALHRAKDDAEFSNRVKSEFLANMSHELRTPLNSIMGFSEVIENEMLGPVGVAQYREYAGDIHESGRHLLGLMNDILEFSRVEAGKLELEENDVDVGQLIEGCVRMLKRRATDGKLKLAVRIAKTLPHLRGDERKIRQILLNLLSNASKFTPDGGTVRIIADADAVRGMRIRVVDTGIGIADKDLEKVLEPFGQVRSRATRDIEGTGLGLPLTKTLVEKHGGRLDLKSRPGEGTTVTVRFPSRRLLVA